MSNKLIAVKLRKRFGNLNVGEIAGFSPDVVEKLLREKMCYLLDEKGEPIIPESELEKVMPEILSEGGKEKNLQEVIASGVEDIKMLFNDADDEGNKFLTDEDLEMMIEMELEGKARTTLITAIEEELENRNGDDDQS